MAADAPTVPKEAVQATDDAGHPCVDCNKVTEVELLYFKLEYSLPAPAQPGKDGKKPKSPYAPGEVVDSYGHAAHLSRVRIYRSTVTPTELWGVELSGANLEERAKAVQNAAKTKKPVESVITGSPQRKGASMIWEAYCFNNDVGSGGADIVPGNESYQLPTWYESPKKSDGSIWQFKGSGSDAAAFGFTPILVLHNKWPGTEDTGVRMHSGREIRHRSTSGGAYPHHLSVDRAGRWTELRATHGCLRLSAPDMVDLYETLKKYTSLDFSYAAKPAAAPKASKKKGAAPAPAPTAESVDERINREGWENATKRSAGTKHVNPYLMVGYLKGEGKSGWCAGREDGLDTRFAAVAKGLPAYKDGKKTPHVCDSMGWSNEDYEAFYASVSNARSGG